LRCPRERLVRFQGRLLRRPRESHQKTYKSGILTRLRRDAPPCPTDSGNRQRPADPPSVLSRAPARDCQAERGNIYNGCHALWRAPSKQIIGPQKMRDACLMTRTHAWLNLTRVAVRTHVGPGTSTWTRKSGAQHSRSKSKDDALKLGSPNHIPRAC